MNNDKLIISVGRQLGSGGRTIAKMLADEFGCKFYDREVLSLAAKESGFSPEFFEKNDERKGFLDQIFHLHVPFISDSSFYDNGLSQENLFRIQSDAIRKAADESSCVFVGRCADYVLRDIPGVLKVFVYAPMSYRIAGGRQHENLPADDTAAEAAIRKADRRKADYYNYYTQNRWGEAASYDLCLNAAMGTETCAHILLTAYKAIQEGLPK